MATSMQGTRGQPLVLRLLLMCGVIAPLFFTVMFLIEGATRANYSALRQPISSLSIGELGWTQMTNFFITGALLVAFAFGVRRATLAFRHTLWGPLLIGLLGVGLIGAGLFTTDPLNGYPPGTPLIPPVRSTHSVLHDMFGVPVFIGLPIACFVFSRWFAKLGERGWMIYSVLSGIGMFAVFVLTSLGFQQVAGLAEFAGLLQRLTLTIGLLWVALLAVYLLKTPVRTSQEMK